LNKPSNCNIVTGSGTGPTKSYLKITDTVTHNLVEIKQAHQPNLTNITKQLQETISISISQLAHQTLAPLQQQLETLHTTLRDELQQHTNQITISQTQIEELSNEQQRLQHQFYNIFDTFTPSIDIPAAGYAFTPTEDNQPMTAITLYSPPSPFTSRANKLTKYNSPRGYKRPSTAIQTQPSPTSHPQLLLDDMILGEEQK